MTTFVIRPDDVIIFDRQASVRSAAAASLDRFCDRLRGEGRHEEAAAVRWLSDEILRHGAVPDAQVQVEDSVLDGALASALLILASHPLFCPMIAATSLDGSLRVTLHVRKGKVRKTTSARNSKRPHTRTLYV